MSACTSGIVRAPHRGFTILELMVAMAIVALVLAVSIPAIAKLYSSMEYRSAVRETVTLLASARYAAINSGQIRDVEINPKRKELRLLDKVTSLPARVNISVQSAGELNTAESGVIRFYPEGGSSGGGVDIENPAGGGVRIAVDWLVGSVSQEKYVFE